MLCWQRRRCHIWVRALAWITAQAVLFTQLAWADPHLLSPSSTAASAEASASLLVSLARLTIPDHLGHIVERWAPADATATTPVVIHIQDLHAEPTTQRTLAKLLAHLHQTLGVSLVAVEGAAGPCETEVFSAFPDRRNNERIARVFLEAGLFTGAEYATITQPGTLSLMGVENPQLYLTHLHTYQANQPLRQRLTQRVSQLTTQLAQRKRRVYPRALQRLEADHAAYEAGTLALQPYLSRLTNQMRDQARVAARYPTLARLARWYVYEGALDLRLVEEEHQALFDALLARLELPARQALLREAEALAR